jgi:soluble lytic murein transglycosylase-like protein
LARFAAAPAPAERRRAPPAASDRDLCRGDLCRFLGGRPAFGEREACAARAPGLPFAVFVTEAAQRFSIPESWIRAVMRVESFGDPIAISSADRVASSIACPPDGVCDIPLRSGRVALKGTEIVGLSF